MIRRIRIAHGVEGRRSMPESAVYVADPSHWGNPYKRGQWRPGAPAAGHVETHDEGIDLYAKWIAPWLDLEPLRGRDLACYCPLDRRCHADVLLELLAKSQAGIEQLELFPAATP